MLPIPFAVAICAEVALTLAERRWPDALPLGGSHIAQLGFLFGGAVVVYEAFFIAKRIAVWWRRRR